MCFIFIVVEDLEYILKFSVYQNRFEMFNNKRSFLNRQNQRFNAEAFVSERWISCKLYCVIELFA